MEEVFAQLHSRELMILGEGIELFSVLVPRSLAGQTLEASKLTTRTELCVIGIQQNGRVVTNPPPSSQLVEGAELYIMGGTRGREAFIRASGRETKR